MNAQASWMDEALSRFYSYLESERRYSPHTLSAYRRDIQAFLDYCEANDVKAWSDIDEPRVRQFVAKQHHNGLSGRSLQRQLSALRTLFKFLCRHQLMAHNPAKDVPAPKSPRPACADAKPRCAVMFQRLSSRARSKATIASVGRRAMSRVCPNS